MKTWQKWTLGCLAGIAIPLTLAAGCLVASAVAGVTPPVEAIEQAAILPPVATISLPTPQVIVPTPRVIVPTQAPTQSSLSESEWVELALPEMVIIAESLGLIGDYSIALSVNPYDTAYAPLTAAAFDNIAASCLTLRQLRQPASMTPTTDEFQLACQDLAQAGGRFADYWVTFSIDAIEPATQHIIDAGEHIDNATALLPTGF